MIANALGHFPRSTAVVPYMALSGGTLIALGTREIAIGRSAALSAVDPVVFGRRAKHIEAGDEDGLHATAREYEEAMRRHLRNTLRARLQGTQGAEGVEKAMAVFMGHNAPHEWPIYSPELVDLGLPVRAAEARWSEYVDARRSWWHRRGH
ncbi:SDH family Clp fold serine proteinase [Nannocystis pusilla]|uniref:SDH family Clp fold serine proteinase n=1 Tax=Nannocystis pusilla TaxID=889268 RepID=UPI003B829E79